MPYLFAMATALQHFSSAVPPSRGRAWRTTYNYRCEANSELQYNVLRHSRPVKKDLGIPIVKRLVGISLVGRKSHRAGGHGGVLPSRRGVETCGLTASLADRVGHASVLAIGP